MARFCAKCGKQLGEQAAFCPACGAKVSRPENQQMQPQAPVKVHKNKTSRNLLAIDMLPSYRTMKYKSPIWGYFHVQKE